MPEIQSWLIPVAAKYVQQYGKDKAIALFESRYGKDAGDWLRDNADSFLRVPAGVPGPKRMTNSNGHSEQIAADINAGGGATIDLYYDDRYQKVTEIKTLATGEKLETRYDLADFEMAVEHLDYGQAGYDALDAIGKIQNKIMPGDWGAAVGLKRAKGTEPMARHTDIITSPVPRFRSADIAAASSSVVVLHDGRSFRTEDLSPAELEELRLSKHSPTSGTAPDAHLESEYEQQSSGGGDYDI